jgi:hypothetical protein
VRILDDFLDAQAFRQLLDAVSAPQFTWQRIPVLFPPPIGLDDSYNVQDVHGFLQRKPGFRFDSDRLPMLQPLLDRVGAQAWVKVKLNRTWQRERNVVYGWHVDTRRPGAVTGIYYLNTNDGYTAFENGQRAGSVANRLVLFDATWRHSGASCTDAPERVVLNMNFMPRPGGLGDFSGG